MNGDLVLFPRAAFGKTDLVLWCLIPVSLCFLFLGLVLRGPRLGCARGRSGCQAGRSAKGERGV